MKKYKVKKKYIKISKKIYFFTHRTLPRYIIKYKRLRFKNFFKKQRMRRLNMIAVAKNEIRMVHTFKYVIRRFRKRSNYSNNRRFKLYSNLWKLWWGVLLSIRSYSFFKISRALFPLWKRFGWYSANLKLNYPQFQVWHLHKKKLWRKLRKRWIWHRLIKRTVRVGFKINLKKYFAYNIAVRKYFKKILPNYELHKKVMYQQAASFLVQTKLAPVMKHAVSLCKLNRVSVNGVPVSPTYIMKPFDIISFNFRKAMLYFKQKRFRRRLKSGSHFKLRKGLIYNKRMRLYIFYRNIDQLATHPHVSYLYYFYFYRNLLQGCRMH